ncbi:integrase core domain-containing protein [Chloroflexota bacterium]
MLGFKTSQDKSAPGSPWKNGYAESFNGKLRVSFLTGRYSRP